MWFTTMITPPSAGMCSIPRQVRRVSTWIAGLTVMTAKRRQKPSLRRTISPSPHGSAANHATAGRPVAVSGWLMHCHGQSTTQPTAPEPTAAWVAVVPVKPLRAAKTRLRGAVPEAVHPDLVLAMARDTVAAVLACRAVARVVVICDDPAVCTELTALGALCLPDVPAAGLNAALAYGAQAAQRTDPTRVRADAGPGRTDPGLGRADAGLGRADAGL